MLPVKFKSQLKGRSLKHPQKNLKDSRGFETNVLPWGKECKDTISTIHRNFYEELTTQRN